MNKLENKSKNLKKIVSAIIDGEVVQYKIGGEWIDYYEGCGIGGKKFSDL